MKVQHRHLAPLLWGTPLILKPKTERLEETATLWCDLDHLRRIFASDFVSTGTQSNPFPMLDTGTCDERVQARTCHKHDHFR